MMVVSIWGFICTQMVIARNIGFGCSKEYSKESVRGLLGGCHWVAYKILGTEFDLYKLSYMTYIVFIVSCSYLILKRKEKKCKLCAF